MEQGETDALFILDIDYFKKVNDTYGHMVGNEVLQKLAVMLRENCPDTAIIGRLGGDEFLIYHSCASGRGEVEALAKTLCEQAGKSAIAAGKNLSISIGVTIIEQTMQQREAFEKADRALYEAKRNGRNGYILLR